MRRLRRWAGPAASLLVLAVVVWRLGTGPLVDGLQAVDATAVLAAAAVVFVTTVCSAWRWTIVARGLGVALPFPAAVAAYYRALFLNLTLPSGVAGEVHRGLSHGRQVHDVGRALRAVVWERGAGQVVQAALTVAILLALPSPVRWAMPFVVVAALAIVAALLVIGRSRPTGAQSRSARVLHVVATDVRNAVLRRGAWPAILVTSVVVVVGHSVTFVIAARTVGATAPTVRLLPLAVIALLAMTLPSIAGWGAREGVTAWVFSAAGLGASRGAAAAVTYGILVLVASLPGAVVLFAGWLPRSKHGAVPQRSDEHSRTLVSASPLRDG